VRLSCALPRILWFDGWEGNQAPWVAHSVAASWEAHNPGWRVQRLSKHNLHDFLSVPYLSRMGELEELTARGWRKSKRKWLPPAQSDVIRLHLLSRYGGVWADATLLCTQPLDDWVYSALTPTGFWAYRSGGVGEEGHACSWFLVATRHSRLLHLWREATDGYWEARLRALDGEGPAPAALGYFWLDSLFQQLLARHAAARRDWAAVAHEDCDAPGGPHMLGYGSWARLTEEQRASLADAPPRALKLSRHFLPQRLGPPACFVRLRRCVRLRATGAFEAVALSMGRARLAAERTEAPVAPGRAPPPDALSLLDCRPQQLAQQLSALLGEVRRRARRARGGRAARHGALRIEDACTLCTAVPRTALARCVPVAPSNASLVGMGG